MSLEEAPSPLPFRVAFGLLLAAHALLYFRHDLIGQLWIDPPFHFTYYGFAWIAPWPGFGMYLHLAAMALCGLALAFGIFPRLSALLAGLGLTYVFLLEQALYLNHVYLLCLVCFLMALVPRPPAASRLSIRLLQFQICVVYFFAGVAKLNGDWLRGEPVRSWLAAAGAPHSEAVVYFVAYGGLLFDLSIVPLLLWRRTRVLALLLSLFFHLSNAYLFPLGVFPWFMLAATTLFLPRSWLHRRVPRIADRLAPSIEAPPAARVGARWRWLLVGGFAATQLLLPLRHHLYPGDVAWTEEGHRFAWRMRVKEKLGSAHFRVRPVGSEHEFWLDGRADLREWQIDAMVNRPDMILQYAHYLRDRLGSELGREVEVRCDSRVSLNGRPFAPLIDPDIDLAAEPRTLSAARWIVRDPDAARWTRSIDESTRTTIHQTAWDVAGSMKLARNAFPAGRSAGSAVECRSFLAKRRFTACHARSKTKTTL